MAGYASIFALRAAPDNSANPPCTKERCLHAPDSTFRRTARHQGAAAVLCHPGRRPPVRLRHSRLRRQRPIARQFEAQFANVVTNITRVLEQAGATFRDLAKVNVLLTRSADVAAMNKLYASAFGPAPYPARTTCVVQALPDPAMLIEIEAVASLAA
jgi:hypothetical protein